MLLPKRNNLQLRLLFCLLLVCCQKIDLTVDPEGGGSSDDAEESVTITGTGEGSKECPYTVTDIRSMSLSGSEAVWVIGYMVGTAPRSMSNATFSADAENQSNILLSNDSLCTDTAHCIPIELSSEKWRKSFSLPQNVGHFHGCLLVNGIPSRYLNRKGLRNVSAGLWYDDFDIASVAPMEWGTITF